MRKHKISLTDEFGGVVRLDPDKFAYFALWEGGGHMNFWNSRDEGCVGSLQFTPDTLGEHADFILKRLQQELGIKLLRMRGGTDPATGRKTDYQFF